MYWLIVELLLGLCIEGEMLCVVLVVLLGWDGFELVYWYCEIDYCIIVCVGYVLVVVWICVNGMLIEGDMVVLVDDGGEYCIEIEV